MSKKVTVKDLVKEFSLEVMTDWNQLHRPIEVSDLHRPGLEMAGFFTYHPVERIQLLGRTELTFLQGLDEQTRANRLMEFCHPDIPCIIITRKLEIPRELINGAKKSRVPVLRTSQATTRFGSRVTNYLEYNLAPSTTLHGVLIDVYGVGVLLMGSSGIGKSETALELVKRGHRLIADDAVEIYQYDENSLVGTAPKLIRYLLEIRGVGIINVMTLFGAGAVRDRKRISLVIQLEAWQEQQHYDRLGLDEENYTIIETEIPKLTIPVRPGRNLAVIIEVAAMNFRLKRLGFHAAQQFVQQLGKAIEDSDDFSDE
ncbi:Hpr(Ser) kinase/phosphatase [Seinonella peptonophila]|uniref:HPr kinase/phosphorylase n=1 Tax=Seinonella peptonophila TaxID=112248 RepID=A0A1M4XPR7_9BACL|nr:HPr(Ser) kinase/phosphatase [Seinonella peptonophila]SHE95222.1 Hpr(Ser) kinase/phosphatase [Seinonella peptonophila]